MWLYQKVGRAKKQSRSIFEIKIKRERTDKMAKLITATDENFKSEVLDSAIPVLVDFWAPWCAPCRIIAPMIEEIASEYEGLVKVAKLNTDENSMISSEYRIMGIPTMAIFVNGEMVDQIVGAVPKHQIVDKLNYYMQGAAVKN